MNFDMALFKHFAVTESKAFEFRAEAFNIFNHTEFAPIAGDGGSATYNGGPSSGTNMASCYGGANNSAGALVGIVWIAVITKLISFNLNYSANGERTGAVHMS
jgi:hypothetical protein